LAFAISLGGGLGLARSTGCASNADITLMTPTTLSFPEPVTTSRDGARHRSRTIDDRPPAEVGAIVLAGSYHSTEGTFSGSLPRPLVPVAQIPVIGYVLRWLRDAGVDRAIICSNRGSGAIRTSVGDGSSLTMALEYAEDATPRGPAGCARDAALRQSADTFLIVDATIIPDFDLHGLLEAHRTSGAAVTAVVHHARSGADARLATPAGIYAFSKRAFDFVAAHGFQDIKEHLLPALRQRRERVMAYSSPQFCPRVLNADTYLAVNHWMIERIPAQPELFERWGPFTVSGELAMHDTVHIHPTARIVGPAILGAGVSIGAGALVVGPTSLGPGTRIAADALVSRSILWNECGVGERAFVDASIVGDGVVVASDSAVHGEVRMNRVKTSTRRWRLVPEVPPLRSAPAQSVADLAIP